MDIYDLTPPIQPEMLHRGRKPRAEIAESTAGGGISHGTRRRRGAHTGTHAITAGDGIATAHSSAAVNGAVTTDSTAAGDGIATTDSTATTHSSATTDGTATTDGVTAGRGVAVAAPHPAAVDAAREVVAAGGNAFDAALAAAAALTVAYPHQCSVGGDLVAIVRPAGGAAQAVLSIGAAAVNVDVPALRAAGEHMPFGGPQTVTVPGVVAGWSAIASLGASMPLATLLEPAIRLADDGVPVSPGLARAIHRRLSGIRADTGLSALLLDPDTGAPVHTLTQPALADTLRQIGANWRAFYEGHLAHRLADGLASLGSPLTADDLAAHRAEVATPLTTTVGDVTWSAAPPPVQGATFLAIIGAAIAAGTDGATGTGATSDAAGTGATRDVTGARDATGTAATPDDTAARDTTGTGAALGATGTGAALGATGARNTSKTTGTEAAPGANGARRTAGATDTGATPAATGTGAAALLEVARRARLARDALLGDPRTGPIDLDGLLLRTAHAHAGTDAGPRPAGDTVAVTAVDRAGNAVTLIQSVFQSFGSGLLEPGTGVVLHNRGASFSLDPAHPARVAPGVRPPHTLCPTLATTPDGTIVALGCQGGRSQPWILAQVAPAVLGSDDLTALLARPRWIIGAREIDRDVPTLLLEPGTPDADALTRTAEALGLEVDTTAGPHDDAGHVQVARLTAGMLAAASDSRADGLAAVLP